jgi:predicted CXXCH cytochrome family protein
VNSGSSTLTADSCAGCHRAHTAQGKMLINAPDDQALCLTCHGTTGGGATTSVVDGVQYADVGADATAHTGAVAGALRGGGFVNARIDSANPLRNPLPRWDSTNKAFVASFASRVPQAADGSAATSAHLKLTGADGVTLQKTAWGSGGLNSGVGALAVELGCVSCHNPHGNGQYRILNNVPPPAAEVGTIPINAGKDASGNTAAGVAVPEMRAANTVTGARNYTVLFGTSLATIQAGTDDYWRRYQPYTIVPIRRPDFDQTKEPSTGTSGTTGYKYDDSKTGFSVCAANPAQNSGGAVGVAGYVNCPVGYPNDYFRGDAPEFSGAVTEPYASDPYYMAGGKWRTAMTNWCSTCHSRYNTTLFTSTTDGTTATSQSYKYPSGDAIYKYRHPTSVECTQCHVAHGSNARMPGNAALGTNFSGDFEYPVAAGGPAAHNGSSRLLKVNNRGSCQQCHDPTGTIKIPTTTWP